VLEVDAQGLRVATATGVLRLRKLQRAGGKMLDAAEFLRGFPMECGTHLKSHPMPELVSAVPFKK
jgi:methionyl-tRNA formyltransferase